MSNYWRLTLAVTLLLLGFYHLRYNLTYHTLNDQVVLNKPNYKLYDTLSETLIEEEKEKFITNDEVRAEQEQILAQVALLQKLKNNIAGNFAQARVFLIQRDLFILYFLLTEYFTICLGRFLFMNTPAKEFEKNHFNHLPDIVITGQKKCGTKTVLAFLLQHPKILGNRDEFSWNDSNDFNYDLKSFFGHLGAKNKKKNIFLQSGTLFAAKIGYHAVETIIKNADQLDELSVGMRFRI